MKIKLFFPFFMLLLLSSCKKEKVIPFQYKTKNVIIVVMDGPRYSETWGDSTHQYIPKMANFMAKKGIVYTNFYNNGPTYTNAGHTAMTTGFYQEINNSGTQLPQYPSIFQHYRKKTKQDSSAIWLVTSKDKLQILSNCEDPTWKNKFMPSAHCGVYGRGIGSGYRPDIYTYLRATEILDSLHPKLMLINFREPDYSAHKNNWNNYVQGITSSDNYIYNIWKFIETNPYYKGTTTLLVTNDHGRHLDGIEDGFKSHGDNCEGCRHINFYATGPDFKQNVILTKNRELIDISATVAELLNFELPNSNGEIMEELFKK